MKVEAITEKVLAKGTLYNVQIEGSQLRYATWDAKVKEYVGQELPEGVTTKEVTNDFGTTVYLNFPKPKQGFTPGGGSRGRSPEEIQTTAKTMLMAYAKDIVVAMIANGMIKDSITAQVQYMAIYETSWMKIQGIDTPRKEPF